MDPADASGHKKYHRVIAFHPSRKMAEKNGRRTGKNRRFGGSFSIFDMGSVTQWNGSAAIVEMAHDGFDENLAK